MPSPVKLLIGLCSWQEALDLITEQRKSLIAPVDSMGCDDAGKLEDDAVAPRLDTDPRVSLLFVCTCVDLGS